MRKLYERKSILKKLKLADKVMVDVLLERVEGIRTIVAEVAHAVAVRVRLVSVHRPRTVVRVVQQRVVVHVRVAGIALSVPVNILLILVAEIKYIKQLVQFLVS
jgi:hypothetical protein